MADLDSQQRGGPRDVEQLVNHRRATLVYLTDGGGNVSGNGGGSDAPYESYRAAEPSPTPGADPHRKP